MADDYVRDPKALRALAHPLRLALLELLATEGAATATRCSELLDASPSACSFHLRVLARHGLIEPAAGGVGRQRPWRLRSSEVTWSDNALSSDAGVAAANAATRVFIEREVARLLAWPSARPSFPKAWQRGASVVFGSVAHLTRAELAEFQRELRTLIERYDARSENASLRPRGSRPVRLLGITVPMRYPGEQP